jgi:hypothetical protein
MPSEYISSDTLATTKGPSTIANINIGDNLYALGDKNVVVSKVLNKIHTGNKRFVMIRTEGRSINTPHDQLIATVNVEHGLPHPTRSWDVKSVGTLKWKRAHDVCVNDKIVCANRYYGGEKSVGGINVARLIGAWLGDGWFRANTTNVWSCGLAIGGKEDAATVRYLALLEEMFPNIRWNNNAKGAFGLTCNTKSVYQSIKELGSLEHLKKEECQDIFLRRHLLKERPYSPDTLIPMVVFLIQAGRLQLRAPMNNLP